MSNKKQYHSHSCDLESFWHARYASEDDFIFVSLLDLITSSGNDIFSPVFKTHLFNLAKSSNSEIDS